MPTHQHETILANSVEPTASTLIIHLQNRATVHVPWHSCPGKIADANAVQRECLELSPGGYGIHWPLLDEDFGAWINSVSSEYLKQAREAPRCFSC